MRALSQSRFLRFFTFGALYFAQGVPWGFISTAYIVFMADQGLSNDQVGSALALAYFPWSLKWLFAGFIDGLPIARWGFGRRRPYIIVAELLMGLTLFGMAFLGDLASQLPLVSAILLAHNICAALQDVAVDALAVDILPQDERGRANSIMWSCKVAGVAVGGGGGVKFAKLMGWPALMIAMAVIIWLVMLIPLFVREQRASETVAQIEHARPSVREILSSFTFAAPLLGFAIAFLCPSGFALVPAFTVRMLRADFHYSDDALSTLSGVVEPLAGVVGAIVGGWVADRMGVKRAMAVGITGTSLLLAAFALSRAHWGVFSFLVGWNIVFHLFTYTYQAASLGFFMTLSNPAIGATHFALYMATTNLCYSVTAKLGGFFADRVGYENTYFIAAAVQLGSVLLLPLCNLKQAEKRFHGATHHEPTLPAAAPGPMPDPGA